MDRYKIAQPQRNIIIRKKRRWRPGTVARREVKKAQQSTDLLIPRASFERQARSAAARRLPDDESPRFSKEAIEVLQEAAEAYIIELFTDADICRMHRNRETLKDKDLSLARYLRRDAVGSVVH